VPSLLGALGSVVVVAVVPFVSVFTSGVAFTHAWLLPPALGTGGKTGFRVDANRKRDVGEGEVLELFSLLPVDVTDRGESPPAFASSSAVAMSTFCAVGVGEGRPSSACSEHAGAGA